MRSARRIAVAVLVAWAAVAASAAVAAAPKPDAHDRALAGRLGAQVTAFRAITAKSHDDGSLQKSLDNCATFKKNPQQAFAAVFVLLPVLLADVVDQYKPQLTALHETLTEMHPHALLFRKWLGAETRNFALILQFDNHGQKIDFCRAATVLLSKKSTAQDIRKAIGIDPALIGKLFSSGSSAAGATATRLDPKMRKFFVAAGISVKNAKALTT
jgi:hypothetical protein